MNFFSRLERRALQVNSLLCVGLDPHPEDLNESTAHAAMDFCLRLIEATSAIALAFKPNLAFFEVFGEKGWAALGRVIAAVPEGIPVILDAKWGDIASTAQAYARAAEKLGVQAVTINPYLGRDAVEPFLKDPQRGVFLLCKTSNLGAADLQDIMVLADNDPPRHLYEQVAQLAQKWNDLGNLGLVVGATYPEALARVRQLAPDLWILAPGVGAQGGALPSALQAGLRADGLGMLIPVSRMLSHAKDPRQAALNLREEINRYRLEDRGQRINAPPLPPIPYSLSSLADSLLEKGCVKFGQFTLKSGLVSPIYIDLRRLVSCPGMLSQAATAYLPILSKLSFDHLAALPYAAVPIATAMSLQSGRPMIYPRKEAKTYGTRADIEGIFKPGDRVVVIDDLATTGGSKFAAIKKLTAAGLQVKDVVVLIDRQSGAAEALAQAGFCLHAVFTLAQLLEHWKQAGRVTSGQVKAVREFMGAPR